MKKVLTAIVLVGVSGCSSEVWIRPGTTQFQFSKDRAHCTQRSAIAGAGAPAKGKEPAVDEAKFERCMEVLGYRRRSKSSTVFY